MAREPATGKKRILAVADEVEASLFTAEVLKVRPDLVVACGDLPFDYLEFIVTMVNVPLLYVPGNHDPELAPALSKPLVPAAFEDDRPAGPEGCTNVDGRIEDAAGLRAAGLGGCLQYNNGPNQYTEGQMTRRALRLEARCRARTLRDGKGIDILVTHAPPLGVGDDPDDDAHRGFRAFHRLVQRLSPHLLIHGHVHPHGQHGNDRAMADTMVINAISSRVIEVQR